MCEWPRCAAELIHGNQQSPEGAGVWQARFCETSLERRCRHYTHAGLRTAVLLTLDPLTIAQARVRSAVELWEAQARLCTARDAALSAVVIVVYSLPQTPKCIAVQLLCREQTVVQALQDRSAINLLNCRHIFTIMHKQLDICIRYS